MDFKTLIKQRGIIKSSVTKLQKYFCEFDEDDDYDLLSIKFEKLNEYEKRFYEVQSAIETHPDYKEEDTDRSTYDDLFDQLKLKFKKLSNQYAKTSIKLEEESLPVYPACTIPMKLPEINLPVFNGHFMQWANFHQTFKALVHSADIPDINKFYYLKCSLKGDASQILDSLEVSSANYKIAWDLLTKRYGNEKQLISKHVRELFNLPKIDREGNNLRKLLDDVTAHIRALSNLGQPTEYWDTLLIHIITSKLDAATTREWENKSDKDKTPTMKDLECFLEHKCRVIESIELNKSHTNSHNQNSSKHTSQPFRFQKHSFASTSYHAGIKKCDLCNENQHPLYLCREFKNMSVPDREKEVKKLGNCFNCLKNNHRTTECKAGPCKTCGKRHNTLLHYTKPGAKNATSFNDVQQKQGGQQHPVKVDSAQQMFSGEGNQYNPSVAVTTSSFTSYQGTNSVLLSTAVVHILDNNNRFQSCRILLDSGSQSNFISEKMVHTLGLPSSSAIVEVCGIGQSSTKTSKTVQCIIKSRFAPYTATIQCVVLKCITQQLPTTFIPTPDLEIPSNLQLADPHYYKPSNIDLLIGAELFFDLLLNGKFKLSETSPTLQNTVFGWVVTGKVGVNISSNISVCHLTTVEEVDKNIQRFWDLENCGSEKKFTGNDKLCEDVYEKTTTRDNSGKYCVQIPLKGNTSDLGESKDTAMRRFLALEKRFHANPELHDTYSAFMKDYEKLGHMKEVSDEEINSSKCYYIPHHYVTKHDSSTTKLRVVFDASCKTSSGVSLNDISIVGPKVQSDLLNIIIRFRKHRWVIVGDIEKMYRQIFISPSQTNLQLILWRENKEDPIKTYKLCTVTYGTASAPYLATRTLNQLATDEEVDFPEASKILKTDVYVDDVLSGNNDLNKAKQIQRDLIEITKRGGFHLRKWCSNSEQLLSDLLSEDVDQKQFSLDEDASVKTLGIVWNPKKDVFQYSFKRKCVNQKITKRTILASIGQIFDPLGLLGPVIVIAKLLLQTLWTRNIEWDDEVPNDIEERWKQFQMSLKCFEDLEIPRCLIEEKQFSDGNYYHEIHGFSDASETAYGAVVYLMTVSASHITTNLIATKSRVAPIRQISLPRLELCGAVLLSELVNNVKESLDLPIRAVHMYTDSTIVLAWINAPSSHWTTFVSNRVAKIQEISNGSMWKYVPSEFNPADCLSRGLFPEPLINCDLYWKGPTFLLQRDHVFVKPLPTENTPESRKIAFTATVHTSIIDAKRYSSFMKVVHIVAYCHRFLKNIRSKKGNRLIGPLTASELLSAELSVVRMEQRDALSSEYTALTSGKFVDIRSKLSSLHPHIDEEHIIRVGGRLHQSSLPSQQRHPIVLPKGHLAELIAKHYHISSLHAGPQTLLTLIRQKYWPINGRNLVKKIFHMCIKCFKTHPKSEIQFMGQLPAIRVNPPPRAFHTTGVDYCGPFLVTPVRKRGSKTQKCYVALFTCFHSRAIHLEVVEDLSTAAFLACFKRFMARRGKVKTLYSDNATNFAAASKELKGFLQTSEFQNNVVQDLSNEGMEWKFIPAGSPHFGALWESSVKLVKTHLKRTIGLTCLSLSEFHTLIYQIESCVNSRPLTPLSEEPSDFSPLTPAHFIIGDTLLNLPEPTLDHIPVNRLDHWKHVQKMFQHFWARWSSEYLTSLQQRSKWRKPHPNIKLNDLVVIKEDNMQPLRWRMARVSNLHPGPDGLVRVVSLQTPNGIIKRAIVKLCPLPATN